MNLSVRDIQVSTRIATSIHECAHLAIIRAILWKFAAILSIVALPMCCVSSCGYSFVGRGAFSSVKIEFPANDTEWRNFEPTLMKYLVSEITGRGIGCDQDSPYRLKVTLEVVKPSVAVPGNLDQPLVGSVDVRASYTLSYSSGAVIRSGSATASSSFSNEIAKTFDDSMAENLQSIARQIAGALE